VAGVEAMRIFMRSCPLWSAISAGAFRLRWRGQGAG
jgi:hypothetical protein